MQQQSFDSVLRREGLFWGPYPSVYDGGMAGTYMLGPQGALLYNNIIQYLRDKFRPIGFSELVCPCLGPFEMWEASGHVGGFLDPLVVCPKCKQRFRGDHLLGTSFPEINTDDIPLEALGAMIRQVDLRCPKCDTRIEDIRPYPLMFAATVGASQRAFLRPETATTTYVGYEDYRRYFRGAWPL